MSDIFDDGNHTEKNESNENPLDALVGEGKKFKTVEDLARGKLESDNYIKQLTTALEQASQELRESDAAKELLESLNARRQKTQGTTTQPVEDDENGGTNNRSGTSSEVSEDQIARLVEQTLTKKESERTALENRKVAATTLEQQFGDKAGEVLRSRATELGMTVQRLGAIAEDSPTAFLKLLGVDGQPPKDRQAPHTQVRSEGQSQRMNPEERTNSWYVNLRRTNRAEYYSPATQARMYKDAERLGDAFWQ